jgi:hypothetical protein
MTTLPPRESLFSQRPSEYHATLTAATESALDTLPLLSSLGKIGGYYPSIASRCGCSSVDTLGLLAGSSWGVP